MSGGARGEADQAQSEVSDTDVRAQAPARGSLGVH